MTKSGQPPKSFATETRVVTKTRRAGVSPASEPRQLLLGQHDLCRLEAGDTFFLTTTEGTEISQSNQAATKNCPAETLVMRKHRSAGVSPASEPRQLLLGQHDLCRLEAGDTFFLTTTEGTEISQRHQGSPCLRRSE